MNVLIIYAHPSKKSYTHLILEKLTGSLKEARHRVEISDLYKNQFQPAMTEAEYEREAFHRVELPVPDDVKAEQEKIERADCVIFLYPVWWSDCPAILKGWFDRVFTLGYAYGYDERGQKHIRMRKIKLGLALCTAGHPNEVLEENGIAEGMRKLMLLDRFGARFEKREMIILGGTLDKTKVQTVHLDTVAKLGSYIENTCR